MSLNKAMLIGHVGQIEIKSFDGQNGTKKCAVFSLATTERYKDRSGNYVDNTEWHNIVSWNNAEFCENYVQKGSQIYVEGRIRTRSFDDKSGNKRYVTEILADSLQLLGKKEDNQQKARPAQSVQTQKVTSTPLPTTNNDDPTDDLPF